MFSVVQFPKTEQTFQKPTKSVLLIVLLKKPPTGLQMQVTKQSIRQSLGPTSVQLPNRVDPLTLTSGVTFKDER